MKAFHTVTDKWSEIISKFVRYEMYSDGDWLLVWKFGAGREPKDHVHGEVWRWLQPKYILWCKLPLEGVWYEQRTKEIPGFTHYNWSCPLCQPYNVSQQISVRNKKQAELGVPHSKYKLSGPNVVLDKCCMDKDQCDSVHLFQIVIYVYIQSMVNIWSLYAWIQGLQT